ncbi:hypothetical protein QBC33DRAFT_62083 [Phialemonium atrogriseum]|uniref:Uncharacterized protein n=1 Tax=Phialemonium atrogriseum TaxID=1093897 RepID=A0AAJ0FMJ6_9PEZI|nr:uncharacterized protein QBC33DRAFT_62083 [Phialemonium atrogriseum]KAK1767924.1 hypothetical protein QBC33DRAFT_62083 [Phialemonium atrogriseum]
MRHEQLATAIAAIYLASTAVATPVPAPQVPPDAEIEGDQDQVTINPSPETNSTATHLPITATIFSGVPGPNHCRGRITAALTLPPPVSGGGRTGARCYDLPGRAGAGCAYFVANKGDGCEARLFAEPGCAAYVNTAVFVPEERIVGGLWRSLSVECGIPTPDPASLGAPPLADLLEGAKGLPG